MTTATVNPARPVGVNRQEAHPDPRSGRRAPRRPPARPGIRNALIAAALPDADSDGCELIAEMDGAGTLVGVVVQDRNTGRTIVTLSLAHLIALVGDGDGCGLFLERCS